MSATATEGRRVVRAGGRIARGDRVVRVEYVARDGEPVRPMYGADGELLGVQVGDFAHGSDAELVIDAETGEERERFTRAQRDAWLRRLDRLSASDPHDEEIGWTIKAPRTRVRMPHARSNLRCRRPGVRRAGRPSRSAPCSDDGPGEPPRPERA